MTNRELAITIIKESLPDSVDGACMLDAKTGKYKILINDSVSEDEQAVTFIHEMLHIWNNDHGNKEKAAAQVEKDTHAQLKRLLKLCIDEK